MTPALRCCLMLLLLLLVVFNVAGSQECGKRLQAHNQRNPDHKVLSIRCRVRVALVPIRRKCSSN
jgi:hypothetical protein